MWPFLFKSLNKKISFSRSGFKTGEQNGERAAKNRHHRVVPRPKVPVLQQQQKKDQEVKQRIPGWTHNYLGSLIHVHLYSQVYPWRQRTTTMHSNEPITLRHTTMQYRAISSRTWCGVVCRTVTKPTEKTAVEKIRSCPTSIPGANGTNSHPPFSLSVMGSDSENSKRGETWWVAWWKNL